MANRNNLLTIPLNGDLNLNKNKINIAQFVGWNKVNGPIYGGCLSPLYSKQRTFSDVWDRNGNYFNVENGTLKKNGNTVLNVSTTGFKKEVSDLQFDSFDVYVNGGNEVVYGIKETATAGTFAIHYGNQSEEAVVFSSGATITTKVKRTSGGSIFYVVLYADSTGNHYWIKKFNGQTYTGNVSISFKNAGIQIADLNSSNTMFSFFSNFGPDQTDCVKYNLLLSGTTMYADDKISFNCVNSVATKTAYKELVETANIKIVRAYGLASYLVHFELNLSEAWIYDMQFVRFAPTDEITNEGGVVRDTLKAGSTYRLSYHGETEPAGVWAIRTQTYDLESGNLKTVTLPCNYIYNKEAGGTSATNYTQSLYSTYTATGSYIVNVETVNDDGKLYAVSKPVLENEDSGLISQNSVICVKGEFASVVRRTTSIIVNFTALKNIQFDYVTGETSAYGPQKYESYSISMGQGGYIKIVYNFVSGNGETPYNYEYDSTFDKISYCGGVLPGTGRNLLGGDSNLNGWRILYNNGYISNISYYDADGQIGTLVADWNTIDDTYDIVRLSDRVYFKTTNGEVVKVTLTTEKDWTYQFLQNRYLIINTKSYYNGYDSKLNKKFHWGSDYNNRVNLGNSNFVMSTVPEYGTYIVASSQNGNYEATGESICSAQFGAVVYANVVKGYEQFADCKAPENDDLSRINFYIADGSTSTTAIYETSFLNDIYFMAPALIDLYYPVPSNGNMYYNPNIFTKFVSTYNNKDMVTSDGTSYSLVYSGITPIFLFAMLSGIEEMDAVFVIQTQYYGVSGNKIYSMSFNDGVVSLGDVVANITGMQYLGALPTRALFYSPMNRCIYSFGGDAILQLNIESNEVTEVYGTWYNTATQALYLGTNNGLYIISDNFMYRLDFSEVADIFFTDDGHSVINTDVSTFLAYNEESGYTPIELDLETKYFGIGNNQPCNIDCWYIKLYNNDKKEKGKVSVQCSTITDKGTVNEKKEFQILENTWDKNDDYIYLRYQPSLQKGIGCKLMLKTKFPIIDLAVSYTAFDGAAQVSHNNL